MKRVTGSSVNEWCDFSLQRTSDMRVYQETSHHVTVSVCLMYGYVWLIIHTYTTALVTVNTHTHTHLCKESAADDLRSHHHHIKLFYIIH